MKGWVIPGLVRLLLALPLFYFLVVSSIACRLVRFGHHLKAINQPAIAAYPGDTGNDGIRLLFGSYNAMLLRMAEAIRAAHRSELVKE